MALQELGISMSSVYDRYRRIQKRKRECEFEKSADFIRNGGVSVYVEHVRLDQERNAGLVFNHKEGPDDAIFFTELFDEKDQEFLKSDYFVWENTYYLVYEDVRLVNKNLNYKKQRAVECNVFFKIGDETVRGAFFSSMRSIMRGEDFPQKYAILAAEAPLVIIPTLDQDLIGERISIGGKPWRIRDYDAITNLGITYLYLERGSYRPGDEDFDKEKGNEGDEGDNQRKYSVEHTNQLEYLVEHTFESKNGYFVSVPSVDVISQDFTSVTFMIPFYGSDVEITIKNEEGKEVTTIYKVVRL